LNGEGERRLLAFPKPCLLYNVELVHRRSRRRRSCSTFNPAGLGKGVPCVDGPPMQIPLLLQIFLFYFFSSRPSTVASFFLFRTRKLVPQWMPIGFFLP
jgi:hypothetical protein